MVFWYLEFQVNIAFVFLILRPAGCSLPDRGQRLPLHTGKNKDRKEELSAYWGRRIGNVRNLQISIENIEIHLIDDRHAWTTARETISMEGEVRQAIVSNIFLLENSQWKILLDHTTYLN
jgi:hypothetical protein